MLDGNERGGMGCYGQSKDLQRGGNSGPAPFPAPSFHCNMTPQPEGHRAKKPTVVQFKVAPLNPRIVSQLFEKEIAWRSKNLETAIRK